jgi:hypothetical protein
MTAFLKILLGVDWFPIALASFLVPIRAWIFSSRLAVSSQDPETSFPNDEEQEGDTYDPGNTQHLPIFTAGPFGIQVGWLQGVGAQDGPTITEITFGGSFGVGLLGFNNCFNQVNKD